MRFFVIGVGGQLGHDVMNELAKRGYEGVGTDMAPKYFGWFCCDNHALCPVGYYR